MNELIFYEKGCYQPQKGNDEVLSDLITYQDTDDQTTVYATNLKLAERRFV
jgi:hypothetical protein